MPKKIKKDIIPEKRLCVIALIVPFIPIIYFRNHPMGYFGTGKQKTIILLIILSDLQESLFLLPLFIIFPSKLKLQIKKTKYRVEE